LVANSDIGMRQLVGVGAVALGLLAACSGGGGSAAKMTTTTSTTTSTTVATTTTTRPENAVKQAYLDYWKMIDRLEAAPDPNDPELELRTVEPRLSATRDGLATSKAKGETVRTPPNGLYSHVVQSVQVVGSASNIIDCSVDDQVQFDSSGNAIDSAVVTKHLEATLALVGTTWKVSSVRIASQDDGVQPCGA
jgi:hypothetical protein